jgi:response regulator RpfG family c-di-GMP phosphodiesterase
MGVDLAFKELEDGAGSQFDPVLVKKIMNLSVCREKILSIIRSKVHHGE